MKFSLKTLIAVISVCAVVCLGYRQMFIVPNLAAERHIRTSPLKTTIRDGENREKWSDRISYSVGEYGVSEFGNVRLAIRGDKSRGKSSAGVSLSNEFTFTGTGGGSSTGVGNRSFSAFAIAGGSTCTFNGIPFQIVKGKLALDGKEFDALGPPLLIIVDRQGRVETVEAIESVID